MKINRKSFAEEVKPTLSSSSKLAQALTQACHSSGRPTQELPKEPNPETVSKPSSRAIDSKVELQEIKIGEKVPQVLVVDDDSGVRRGLARILRREGCSPITTGDGHAVVDLCTRMRPSLIFLDLSMPNFNGPQVLKALKECLGRDYPPVVWITGSVSPENLKKLGGAVACIPKPLDSGKIRQIIDQYLQDKKVE